MALLLLRGRCGCWRLPAPAWARLRPGSGALGAGRGLQSLLSQTLSPTRQGLGGILVKQHIIRDPVRLWNLLGSTYYFTTSSSQGSNQKNGGFKKKSPQEEEDLAWEALEMLPGRVTVPVLHHGCGDKGGEDEEGGKALSEGGSTDVCTHRASSEESQRLGEVHDGQEGCPNGAVLPVTVFW
ncbi:paraplegin-like [Tyto alba]|uniref:paraplegin-like n=1 Tax=Tyto alba TaxID=56313 RepID=UPI001C6680DD|nr:paraplegin-like [Tyto alba]